VGHASIADLAHGTVVVVPSISFPVAELDKITGALHYEERMLFMLLLLRSPELRLVYVTSLPIDPDIVDYYLRFTPDPDDARRRLHLLTLDDPEPRGLAEKLLERPDRLEELRRAAGDPDDTYVLTFNVTAAEAGLIDALDLPLYGPPPELVPLGSKTGSRRSARRAGVAVLEGREDLRSLAEVEAAMAEVAAARPDAEAVVVKLNDGFSGQGNAIVALDGTGVAGVGNAVAGALDGAAVAGAAGLDAANTVFCAAEESWPSFEAKIAAGGAIVEELVRDPALQSPSVQLRITPLGDVEVISTHDQILGGPDNQVYLGCSFPARESYRSAIQDAALRVGRVLAREGVIGSFGIDFLVLADPEGLEGEGGTTVYLSEINLRLGGTTHPFWMARLATGGSYDAATGELVVGEAGEPTGAGERRVRCYVAGDNLKSSHLAGRTPGEVIAAVDEAGLAYDPANHTGTTLHLLGALPRFGKMGATCIAPTIEAAEQMYAALERLLL